jgi:hypothetical protein
MQKVWTWLQTPQGHSLISAVLQFATFTWPQYAAITQALAFAFGISGATITHPDTKSLAIAGSTVGDTNAPAPALLKQIVALADRIKGSQQ